MANDGDDTFYESALRTIGVVSQLPMVRVDREAFLRRQFKGSPYLDVILERGPQAVYTTSSLRRVARSVVSGNAATTSAASFATGLPGNPAVMVAAGGADVIQYFGFAINLAQKVAYLFGEDDLFEGGHADLPEAAQVRIIGYLGVMFGAASAASVVVNTSKVASAQMGKKFAAQALTKTAWYPLVKKVGALIGKKVTRATVERTVTKGVPVVGGVISGGLTYISFRPMGNRLVETLAKIADGEFEDNLEVSAEFEATLRRDEPEA